MSRRVLLIEDEPPALARIEALVHRVEPGATIVDRLGRADAIAAWFAGHPPPDVVLADIQLEDGLSLPALQAVDPGVPVVFTTAYDRYWMEALATHGIDYLLKPIAAIALRRALDKVDALDEHFSRPWRRALTRLEAPPQHRQRLVARRGLDHVVIPISDVAWLISEHKLTFAITHDGTRAMVDAPLSTLEDELDPARFFRLSRQVIAAADAVVRFSSAGRGRLAVVLQPGDHEVITSPERARAFRAWIAR